MTTRNEHPERYPWWLNELESFGTITNRINKLNNLKEMRSLNEYVKHTIYDDYYNEDVTNFI
jgi:hypothetical protein